MPGRNLSTVCQVFLALAVLLLGADRAYAYVGPGVDVTFISFAMSLLVWVVAAFSAILLWPIYAMLRWIRGRKNESATAAPLDAAQEQASELSHTDS